MAHDDRQGRPGESGTERSGVPDSPELGTRSDNLKEDSASRDSATEDASIHAELGEGDDTPAERPRRRRRRRSPGRRLVKPEDDRREVFTPEHRLLLLDTWRRSGLPASDFSLLCGVSAQTLYTWRRRFQKQGRAVPQGILDFPDGRPPPLRAIGATFSSRGLGVRDGR